MIVRVTTLGAADGSAARAANAVVRYLDGRQPSSRAGDKPGRLPELPVLDSTRGIVGYYADSVEGPGRWLGRGINGMRLEGQVDAEAFRRVLLGQHALSGEQLVGARGSSARAEQAGREAAVVAAHGDRDELLSLPQAGTLLGVSDRYLRRLAAETADHQAEQARAVAAGEAPPEMPSTYLVAALDDDGRRWRVTRAEVSLPNVIQDAAPKAPIAVKDSCNPAAPIADCKLSDGAWRYKQTRLALRSHLPGLALLLGGAWALWFGILRKLRDGREQRAGAVAGPAS